MSAQSYTNKRRILAEASVVKAQYMKSVAVNKNSIYATINCLPNFQPITYIPTCSCPFDGRGLSTPLPQIPPTITAIDGGSSGTGLGNVSLWIDGDNAETIITNYWFDGGAA